MNKEEVVVTGQRPEVNIVKPPQIPESSATDDVSMVIMSKSPKEEGIQVPNPLTIDLVIQNVLHFLPYIDLRNAFCVCRNWRTAAFKESQSRVGFREIGEGETKDLQALYDELSNKSEMNPMKLIKLVIRKWPNDLPLLQRTLRLLGSYLDCLVLPTKGRINPYDLFDALKELPNLSELQLRAFPRCWEDETLNFPNYPLNDPTTSKLYVFENIRYLEFFPEDHVPVARTIRLSDFFKTFPNLVALSVFNLEHENPYNFKEVSFSKLKHLRISLMRKVNKKMVNGSLQMLTELGLKLRRLQFKFCPNQPLVDTNLFRRFVENQKETLEELELVQEDFDVFETGVAGRYYPPNIKPFPMDLPHLKMLSISKPFITSLISIFDSVPSLEEVKIYVPMRFGTYDWERALPLNNFKVYPNLRVLRVDYLPSSMFEALSQYFPSLKVLQVSDCDSLEECLFRPMVVIPEGSDYLEMRTCEECEAKGCRQFNTFLMRSSGSEPDGLENCFAVASRGSTNISTALQYWPQLELLIAGNCHHVCLVMLSIMDMDKDEVKDRAYLKSDVETLGFKGKIEWNLIEAYDRPINRMKQFNGIRWGGPTLDLIWVHFNNTDKKVSKENSVTHKFQFRKTGLAGTHIDWVTR